ncbi:hypothetical protein niasHS_010530 [Heterodera schachtii]|uniref:BHLH domain-containing protein n=1 Tax=Heterodera schachtii TaxID=97005 RepID=A0ABD2J6A7_HETSC
MSQNLSVRPRENTANLSNGIGRRMQRERRRRRTMAIRRSIGQPQRSSSSSSSEVCPSSSKSPNSSRATPLDSEKALSLEEMRELNRLATLLPPSLRVLNPQSNAAQLVLNASHYIAQLTATVFARVSNGTLPEVALGQILSAASLPGPMAQPTPRPRAIRRFSWVPSRRKSIKKSRNL